jgi:hypothetical protein
MRNSMESEPLQIEETDLDKQKRTPSLAIIAKVNFSTASAIWVGDPNI